MKIFVYLKPKDVCLINRVIDKKTQNVMVYPWVDKNFLGKYNLDKNYLLKNNGWHSGDKTIDVIEYKDKKDLARQFLKNKKALIRTQDMSVVWNYAAKGFVINPYSFALLNNLPTPVGDVFSVNVSKDGVKPFSLKKYDKWFRLFKYKWNEFINPSMEFKLLWILRVIYYTAKMNINMQNGITEEPKFPKAEPINRAQGIKRVVSKQTRKQLSRSLSKARQNKKIYGCPYGKNCEFLKRGLICLHSKEFNELAKFFKTRDIELITDGLLKIIQKESKRYEKGIELEKLGSVLNSEVTNIGNNLFKKAVDFMKILKPELIPQATYNILNQSVNISTAVEKLERAGMNDEQRKDLATEIEEIIREQKYKGARSSKVVITEPLVSRKTSIH